MSDITKKDLSKCFKTLVEMCIDRGIDPSHLLSVTDDELFTTHSNNTIFFVKADDLTVIIFNTNTDKQAFAEIRAVVEHAATAAAAEAAAANIHLDPRKRRAIIVLKDKLTSSLKKYIDSYTEARIEPFEMAKLMFNVSHHKYVAPHKLIADPLEIQAIMDKYGAKSKAQFPLIQRDDPMAKYLGAAPGEVVEITRTSPTGGKHVVYRMCI
jgi:DNA-directed RNA polymerase subunit H (RpoH/RPB5)